MHPSPHFFLLTGLVIQLFCPIVFALVSKYCKQLSITEHWDNSIISWHLTYFYYPISCQANHHLGGKLGKTWKD